MLLPYQLQSINFLYAFHVDINGKYIDFSFATESRRRATEGASAVGNGANSQILLRHPGSFLGAGHQLSNSWGPYMVRPVLQDIIIRERKRLLPYIRPTIRAVYALGPDGISAHPSHHLFGFYEPKTPADF